MISQLINDICQHPINNSERRKLMNKLLFLIQKKPELAKSNHPNYLDALNQTFEWLNRSICEQFNCKDQSVENSLLRWVNSHLYWRIRDLYCLSSQEYSLDKFIDSEETTSLLDILSTDNMKTPSLSGLEQLIADIEQEEKMQFYEKIERYINEDSEGILINCHPKNKPQCNCKFLVKRLYLQEPSDKFSILAKELNINYQTLNSHWKRNCIPKLKTIAKQIGYKHE